MKKSVLEIQNQIFNGTYTGQVFSYGNKKIPRNTLIVNLSSAQNFPSKALGLCQVAQYCYALKCERVYPNYRAKNLIVEQWIQHDSTKNIVRLMQVYIENSPEPIKYIRLDEAGDFVNQNQVNQWNKIARYFWEQRGIRTYTYTARADLDFSNAKYILVNGSLPGITGAAREFKCVPANIYDEMTTCKAKGTYHCPGDCTTCHMCFTAGFKGTIYCRRH